MATYGPQHIYDVLRQRVEKDPSRHEYERKAFLWFTRYQKDVTSWQAKQQGTSYEDLRRDVKSRQVVRPSEARLGALYFFEYAPKTPRKKLPYYDYFPLVVPIERYPDGFLGLNFHYLNYRMRAKLFDVMTRNFLNQRKDPLRSFINTDYDLLDDNAKYNMFYPCVHRYQFNRFRTPLLQVPDTEWTFALFLPVDMFRGANRNVVWIESQKKIE
jgi:hypothetical protein